MINFSQRDNVMPREQSAVTAVGGVDFSLDYWDFGDSPEPLMHRIHAYPAKFPAFITQKAVEYARSRGLEINCIADVFCGCGTTALEAKRLGADFWGCDINPVATLIARVKSSDYQKGRLARYKQIVLDAYDSSPINHHATELQAERILYWFDETTIKELAVLKRVITALPSGKYRDFFLCAFSNILKPASRWLTKSIKPQIDPNKKPANVRKAFDRQVNVMIKAVSEKKCNPDTKVQIVDGNFLKMKFEVPEIDLIITSPPYVTSYEYADLHQLSSLWLGYADDFRKLREGSIGSLFHKSVYEQDIEIIESCGKNMVQSLYKIDRRKARASARYFADMLHTVEKCRTMLHPGGMLLFVIGNTEYKGIKIDNAKYLYDCMVSNGFSDLEIHKRKISAKILTPYRDKTGRFSSNSENRHIYAEEFILTGILK